MKSSGFTLIELLVVLTILGITSLAVLPAFKRAEDGSVLDEAAEPVLAMLRQARRTALVEAVAVTVTIDPERATYQVTRHPHGIDEPLTTGTLRLPDDASLSASTPRVQISFGSTGSAGGDSLVVRRGLRAAVIAVDAWSGIPRVSGLTSEFFATSRVR